MTGQLAIKFVPLYIYSSTFIRSTYTLLYRKIRTRVFRILITIYGVVHTKCKNVYERKQTD